MSTRRLEAHGLFFRDAAGRAVVLRGVNFSPSQKHPPGQPSQHAHGFWDAETDAVSFVPNVRLDDGSADTHLRRIRSWGFNCLRYQFTWEAIEHAGPRQYDADFLAHTVAVLRRAKAHGFYVVMDPHQDLFSRFCSGDGAPYWTLLACGLDPRHFSPTLAAIMHHEWPRHSAPDPEAMPKMLWATNYERLAAATMFVLFFGGRTFAPCCIIDDMNIQDWLQDHFIGAVQALVNAVRDAGDLFDECVIGWDCLNEPNSGYIGWPDLTHLHGPLRQGPMPTPLQAFRLGMGQAQMVDHYELLLYGPQHDGTRMVDPQGVSAWLSPERDRQVGSGRFGWRRSPSWQLGTCIWAQHGVWNPSSDDDVVCDYFSKDPTSGAPIDFVAQFWLPHWKAYVAMIRHAQPQAVVFVQTPVFELPPPGVHDDGMLAERACASPHFYDGLTLITKHWNNFNFDTVGYLRGNYWSTLSASAFGRRGVREVIRRQVTQLCVDTAQCLGSYPTWLGETGIPMNLDQRKAYYERAAAGDYSVQCDAMDATLSACDDNLVGYALASYVPTNSFQWGDGWNGEDSSVWSADLARIQPPCARPWDAFFRGARAIAAWCRPYPTATVGTPLTMSFDMHTSEFSLSADVSEGEPDTFTEIYLPFVHYGAHLPTLPPTMPRTWSEAILRRAPRRPQPDEKSVAEHKERVAQLAEAAARLRSQDTAAPGAACAAYAGTAIPATAEALVELDIDVHVSDGFWECRGQYLRWYASPGRHTLHVRRRAGPVDFESWCSS